MTKEDQDRLIKRIRNAERLGNLPGQVSDLLRECAGKLMMLRAERDELKRNLELANDLLRWNERPYGCTGRGFAPVGAAVSDAARPVEAGEYGGKASP